MNNEKELYESIENNEWKSMKKFSDLSGKTGRRING